LLVIEQVLEASTAERKQVLPGKTSVSPMAASSEQKGIPMGNDNHQGLGSRIHALFAADAGVELDLPNRRDLPADLGRRV
jgi:hypothetical protein